MASSNNDELRISVVACSGAQAEAWKALKVLVRVMREKRKKVQREKQDLSDEIAYAARRVRVAKRLQGISVYERRYASPGEAEWMSEHPEVTHLMMRSVGSSGSRAVRRV